MKRNSEIRAAYYGARPRELRLNVRTFEYRDGVAAGADGTFGVRGFASVTNAPYMVSDWLGDYTETIARGAFGKSLSEREDVRFLINHDGIPLARTSSGTLTLREISDPLDDPTGRGQTGLWVEADLDAASPLAQTLRSAMARGDVSQMSFAFQALRQEWNEDYSERTINEVRMYDVSAVAYPASLSTSIELDSADLAELVGRMDSGRLSPADREMFREIVARFESLGDEERDDESAPGPSDEAQGPTDDERAAEIDIDVALITGRQNKLDALKRRYI